MHLSIVCAILFALSINTSNAIAPINIVRPYDETFLFLPLPKASYEWNVLYEKSTSIGAVKDLFWEENQEFLTPKVNVMHVYQSQQDSLAALKGFETNSPIGQLSQAFTIDDDNHDRGHFIPHGKLGFQNGIFSLRYTTHHVSFTASLPFCQFKLSDVFWKDLTNTVTAEDILVHDLLTDSFEENMLKLANLRIKNYNRIGFSDLYTGITYNQIFYRPKGMLNSVGLQIQGGFTWPTGKKRDPYQVLAFEFGNNGAVGAIFAGGLDLHFADYLRAGANAQFLYLFGNTINSRMRTDTAQTDLLFLQLDDVYTKWGLTQKFYIYGELYKILKNISFQAGYQYIRHDLDKIYPTNEYIYAAQANNAPSLQEWTINTMVLKLRYEPDEELPDRCWSPRLEFFYKKGFNGRNSFLSDSLGAHISISF